MAGEVSRRLALAGLASAALALPGCKKAPVATTVGGRKRVRLTYSNISVARTRGVFEQGLRAKGIDVEWVGPYPNHAPTLQAVATDAAEFSFGGSSTPAAQAIVSGAPLAYVAWASAHPRNGSSIIVLPNSGIRSVKDLAGKTVAANKAGVAEFVLVAALEKYGVPRGSVNLAYMNPPDAAPAFAAGKVDAWAIWTGPRELAEVKYGAVSIFDEGAELPNQIDFGSYLVRKEYARQEPETIRAVIEAYREESAWSNAHFAEAQALANKVTKYPQAAVDKIVAKHVEQRWSFMNAEGVAQLQAGADWLSDRKVLSGRLRIADHAVLL